MTESDVLIAGSGIAGLSLAIKLSSRLPDRKIFLLTKEDALDSNTRFAQGGIAVVCDKNDSFESHIADTLKAGDGLCDVHVVQRVIQNAPDRLRELMQYGAEFDRDNDGQIDLAKEGGHSVPRVVHHKDMTGLEIAQSLLRTAQSIPNLVMLTDRTVLELIVQKENSNRKRSLSCYGVTVLNTTNNTFKKYSTRIVVLATGGLGQVYATTTNPIVATGDGIALAHRAGAQIHGMEFIQFHPTALYSNRKQNPFLISEALRGFGAYLRNEKGERFMARYHPQAELACRDVVSRCIDLEIKQGECPSVFLDCTHLRGDDLRRHFPGIYSECLQNGFNLEKDMIPVAPAAHYLCGGISVDGRARTTIQNLYAIGECSHTGLHGANRLASNSLLEAAEYAHNCYVDILEEINNIEMPSSTPTENISFILSKVPREEISELRRQVQVLMTQHAGVSRSTTALVHARNELARIERRTELLCGGTMSREIAELRNIVCCAKLIVRHSLERTENRGVFHNVDLICSPTSFDQP